MMKKSVVFALRLKRFQVPDVVDSVPRVLLDMNTGVQKVEV